MLSGRLVCVRLSALGALLALLLGPLVPFAEVEAQDCGENVAPDGTEGSCAAGGGGDAGGSPLDPDSPDDPGNAGTDPLAPKSTVGNPISLFTGNKQEAETDFALPGTELAFRRFYNSANETYRRGLGQGWSHTYAVALLASPDGGREIVQGDGRRLYFKSAGTDDEGRPIFRTSSAFEGELVADTATDHRWRLADGRELRFNGGYLVEIDWPDQRNLALYYRHRRVESVTDETGRVLRFAYWPGAPGGDRALGGYDAQDFGAASGQLRSVTLPDGGTIGYEYDELSNLTRVSYPDGTHRKYHYEAEGYPSHLTRLTDRTGVRYGSWTYDGNGRATSSEHAGGVERVTLEYPETPAIEAGQTVTTMVTNSLGERSLYTWEQPVGGAPRMLEATGAGCASCPPTGMRWSYDAAGRLAEATITGGGTARGAGTTSYAHDEVGRLAEIRRTTPDGTSVLVERREYASPSDLQPIRIARPSVNPDGEQVTELERDGRGRVTAITERGWAPLFTDTDTDTIGGVSGATFDPEASRTYAPIERTVRSRYANGRLIAIDGPREDVEDITRFEWDENHRLRSIAPPLEPTLRFEQYDALGRAAEVRIGAASPYRIAYAAHGGIESIEHLGTRTRLEYDPEGRLVASIGTDGRRSRTAHDDAGRVVSFTDDLGLTLERRYDSESRLENETVLGIGGNVLRSVSSAFDALSAFGAVERLRTRTEERLRPNGEMGRRASDFEYDDTGELSGIVSASSGARIDISAGPEARSTSLTGSDGTTTTYLVDLLGQGAGIIDPRGNRTDELRDDFGRSVGTLDPSTGPERLELDAAGDVTARVRGDDERTIYSRDAAGRLLERRHPDGSITRWQYDPVSGGISRTESAGGIDLYARDREGRITRHERRLGEHAFVTEYTYDARSRLLDKRLPDGQSLHYDYHESGPNAGTLRAITKLRWFGLDERAIVSDIDLERRDGSAGWRSHNGIRTTMTVAPAGEIVSIESPGVLDLGYGFDEAGHIDEIVDGDRTEAYAYSGGRLRAASSPEARHTYDYDAVGNRLAHVVERDDGSRAETTYRYAEAGEGNRLLESSDTVTGLARAWRYAAGGMPLDAGELRYTYDAERRPVTVSRGDRPVARYAYDALGQRTQKTLYPDGGPPVTTYFLYEEQQLVAEANGTGEVTAQYLYLEPHRPVAKLEEDRISAIHTDHIGTPLRMSDANGETVWAASHDPFGKATITQEEVALPLRYPGQYFDAETGTHYNYFRDYDPETGRYLTSDPIGLAGGGNGYAYANLDPLGFADPLGLAPGSVLSDYIRDLIERSGGSAFLAPAAVTIDTVAALLYALGTADASLLINTGVAHEIEQANLGLNYDALFQEILLYDPGFNVASDPGSSPDRDDVLFLAGQLRQRQDAYIATGACAMDFDQELYDRAVELQNLIDLLDQDIRALDADDTPLARPFTSPDGVRFPSEMDYRVARFNYEEQGGREGTGLDFADWVAAGSPSKLVAQQSWSRARQRALLRDAMNSAGTGKVAHHVIPLEALSRFPDLLRKGAEGGFDINDSNNGILLDRVDHIGGHPQYNQAVLEALGGIDSDASPAVISRALQRAADTLTRAINNGTYGPWG